LLQTPISLAPLWIEYSKKCLVYFLPPKNNAISL
jgi:hypothetical protein